VLPELEILIFWTLLAGLWLGTRAILLRTSVKNEVFVDSLAVLLASTVVIVLLGIFNPGPWTSAGVTADVEQFIRRSSPRHSQSASDSDACYRGR
jgi:hypothetical protein